MSIHHLECAAELKHLIPSKKLVLMAVCDDADKETRLGAPGIDKLHLWSGIKAKSQVLAVIAELVAEGYLERVSPGRKGRKAVFRVFSRVGCCALHGPAGAPANDGAAAAVDLAGTAAAIAAATTESGSGVPDAAHSSAGSVEPDPKPAPSGSAQPDPATSIGSGEGSGLDRTPPVSPENNPPTPASGGVGCARHRGKPGINCRGCGTTNRQLAEARKRARAEAEAAERLEAQRQRLEAAAARERQHDPAQTARGRDKCRQAMHGSPATETHQETR